MYRYQKQVCKSLLNHLQFNFKSATVQHFLIRNVMSFPDTLGALLHAHLLPILQLQVVRVAKSISESPCSLDLWNGQMSTNPEQPYARKYTSFLHRSLTWCCCLVRKSRSLLCYFFTFIKSHQTSPHAEGSRESQDLISFGQQQETVLLFLTLSISQEKKSLPLPSRLCMPEDLVESTRRKCLNCHVNLCGRNNIRPFFP